MFPVRCYSCNTVLAQHYPHYRKLIVQQEHPKVILDSLNVRRMCCRRMFLGHVETDNLDWPQVDIEVDATGTLLKRYSREIQISSCD